MRDLVAELARVALPTIDAVTLLVRDAVPDLVGTRECVPLTVDLLVRVALARIVSDALAVRVDVPARVGARVCVAERVPLRVRVEVGDGCTRTPAENSVLASLTGAFEVTEWVEVTLVSRTHRALNGDHA